MQNVLRVDGDRSQSDDYDPSRIKISMKLPLETGLGNLCILQEVQIAEVNVILPHSFFLLQLCKYTRKLTRAGPVLRNIRVRPGEGGGGASNSAPRRRGEKQKVAFESSSKSFQNHFSHFFAHVKIEVTRGDQMANLANLHISSEMCRYYGKYYRQEAAKKRNRQPLSFSFDEMPSDLGYLQWIRL